MAALSDEEFATVVSAVNTNISEKDKNLQEEFNRFWTHAFSTHTYKFNKQESDIAMLATINKQELQTIFEEFFFQPNRANRLDMHWNTQVQQTAESQAENEESKEEEVKEQPAAAQTEEATEPEITPTYESEMRYTNLAQFKRKMGLFVDNFKLNYMSSQQ